VDVVGAIPIWLPFVVMLTIVVFLAMQRRKRPPW
jgi:hypothetical protein